MGNTDKNQIIFGLPFLPRLKATTVILCLFLFLLHFVGSCSFGFAHETPDKNHTLSEDDFNYLNSVSNSRGKFSKVAEKLLQTKNPDSKMEDYYWMTLFQMIVSGPQDSESLDLIDCMIRMGASLNLPD